MPGTLGARRTPAHPVMPICRRRDPVRRSGPERTGRQDRRPCRRAAASSHDRSRGRPCRPAKGGGQMELAIALGLAGWMIVIVGALLFGVIAQFVGQARSGYEWLIDAVAAGVGAIVASEFIVAWQTVEPVFDGLALIPALIGGLVVGVVVELITRYVTGGTYSNAPSAA